MREEREPWNAPMGVRATETTKTCSDMWRIIQVQVWRGGKKEESINKGKFAVGDNHSHLTQNYLLTY